MELITQQSRMWRFNAYALISDSEAAVIDPGIFS